MALLCFLSAACASEDGRASRAEADPARGQELLSAFGCIGCHEIPGVVGEGKPIGPPLGRFARRSHIAGRLPNTRENLILWIMNPQAVDPLSAMPSLFVDERQAADMGAYLDSLQ